MATLTCAELSAYPGDNLGERLAAQSTEERPRRAGPPRAKRIGPRPSAPLPATVDIRRFPGRDRVERVMQYLRASVLSADSWCEDALREVATRLIATAEIIE